MFVHVWLSTQLRAGQPVEGMPRILSCARPSAADLLAANAVRLMSQPLSRNRKSLASTGHEAPACSVGIRKEAKLGRLLKAVPLAGVLFVAAGCTMRPDLGFMSLTAQVPVTEAIVVPPPGGPAVIAVLQRKYPNGVTQEIALSTASSTLGQNAFYVGFINNPEAVSEEGDVLRLRPPNPERIQIEMEERLPGIDMHTSLLYAQNKYGPFGFATGRSATGDLCLYAWQQIEPAEPALFVPHGAISVRLRLCDADATEAQLLRTMYSFTISAYMDSGGWTPYGSPPPPPAFLGQMDAPIDPLASRNGIPSSRPRSLSPASRTAIEEEPTSTRIIDKDTVPAEPVQPAAPNLPSAPPTGYPVVPPPPTDQ